MFYYGPRHRTYRLRLLFNILQISKVVLFWDAYRSEKCWLDICNVPDLSVSDQNTDICNVGKMLSWWYTQTVLVTSFMSLRHWQTHCLLFTFCCKKGTNCCFSLSVIDRAALLVSMMLGGYCQLITAHKCAMIKTTNCFNAKPISKINLWKWTVWISTFFTDQIAIVL